MKKPGDSSSGFFSFFVSFGFLLFVIARSEATKQPLTIGC